MKIALIILSLFFLGIWVAGFFITQKTMGIHTALMVALLFYVRSLMVAKSKEAGNVEQIKQA